MGCCSERGEGNGYVAVWFGEEGGYLGGLLGGGGEGEAFCGAFGTGVLGGGDGFGDRFRHFLRVGFGEEKGAFALDG